MEKIVLIGNGGHAKSIVDAIEAENLYEIAGFIAVDVNDEFEYRDYGIIGTDDELVQIYKSGIHNAFICIGYMGKGYIREELYKKLIEIGFSIPEIIDPTALIAKDVKIEAGTFVGKNAVINSATQIGKMCIVNTAAVIEHDCIVDDYAHVAVNATLCGGVVIKERCFIGANATIIQGVVVGSESILGAGAVVTQDIENNCIAVGVPAKVIKKR